MLCVCLDLKGLKIILCQGGREVAQFGADLWKRLNAKGSGEEGSSLTFDRDATLEMINQVSEADKNLNYI